MIFLKDPVIVVMLTLTAIGLVIMLRRRTGPELWLMLLTVLLFALPRAGVVVSRLNLPLPVGHVVAGLVIVFWLLFGRRWGSQQRYLGQFFLLYALAAGLGLALGVVQGGNTQIALLELFFYLVSMGLFFYASETFRQRSHFVLFVRTMLLLSILVGLYGVSQRFFGDRVLVNHLTYNSASDLARSYIGHDQVDFRRVLSSYGDPNVLAGQLLVFIGIGLALFLYKGISRWGRMVGLTVVVVNVFCMLYTGSRAGLIALIIVSIIVLYWHTRWALMVLPVMAILGLMFGPELLNSAIAARFEGIMSSEDIRSQFPTLAWRLLHAFPLGCGLGNQIVMEWHQVETIFVVRPAYNVWVGFNSFWLNLFSRLGVPGLVAFLILLVVLFRYIWHLAKTVTYPLARAVLIGGVAGFIGQGLVWMVNNTYMLPGGGLNFWFMLGMLVAGGRAFSWEENPSLCDPYLLGDTGLGLFGAGSVGQWAGMKTT